MAKWQRVTVLAGTVGLLSACMAGGVGPDGANGAGGSGRAAIPPDATPQENGLPYGAIGWSFEDTEETDIVAVGASFDDGSGTSAETVQITFGSGFFTDAPTDQDAIATLFGEEVTITNGEGTLANGQTVRITFDEGAAGVHAGAVQVMSYAALQNPAPTDPVNGEAHYIFGFLTNPNTINGRISGSVTYTGDLVAAGLVTVNGTPAGDPTGTELDGAITILANFGNDRISGSVNGSYEVGVQTVNVDLTLPSTPFAGNTFAGTFSCGGSCTSTTSLDAGFYGPNADEVAGVLSIDTTHDVSGDDYVFQGAGSFVIEPDTP